MILLTGFFVANAEYERYATGETAVIGDFVYDDDFVATTTAGCTLTVYDPSAVSYTHLDVYKRQV